VAFRDDREILKQKALDLERDLRAAESKLDAQRSETERVQKLEAELAEARAMLTRIEAQLPKPAASSGRRAAVLLVALVAVGVGGMLALTRSREPRPPMPTPVVLHQTARAPVVEVKAQWAGKAKTVTGMPIKVGSPCTVDAVLRSTQKHDISISCGDQVLYRSTDALEGMAQMSVGVEESPAPKQGSARAALGWNDIGARSGARAQASVNSQARVAAAWRETLPAYRVEIEIPELSAPYEGAFGQLR